MIAGEASGDLHASNLVKALLKQEPQLICQGLGGDLMHEQGVKILKHYREMAFMGFAEVIANIRTIAKNFRHVKGWIEDFKPDVLVLVDYPGFNMRMATWAKKRGIKVVYYISPQVWAWKEGRVKTLKATVDKMLCILPFEVDFYAKHNMPAHFVGHPLLDAIANRNPNREEFLEQWSLPTDKKLIAVLPGSRKQEIERMLPYFLELQSKFPQYLFVLAKAPSLEDEYYEGWTRSKPIEAVRDTYGLLENAYAAIVTSGTATLETALFGVPQVVCYKGGNISYQIAKRLVKISYISLVNLVLNREVVKELIQQDLNSEQLELYFSRLLEEGKREQLALDYKELREKLGGEGASYNAATEVLHLLA
ncbi:MAG: lipid-A-disaccharide synthase [Luteibaculum sp.]